MRFLLSNDLFSLLANAHTYVCHCPGVFCLQCHVGLNNDTQVLECEGSWDQLQLQMQEKLGASWGQLQLNMTTGMTAVIDQLKQSLNLDQLADTVQSALSPTADTRRR